MIYVQYGCGLSAPEGWQNFDASPTLRIQKIPIVGQLLESRLNTLFPRMVKYGDIVRGLPSIKESTCDGIYCSHVLEHLALSDLRTALRNTYFYLKPGGAFRLVVPDLEYYINQYITSETPDAAIRFMEGTILGFRERKRGFKAVLEYVLGNSKHLWMWDFKSMEKELDQAGFTNIRRCYFGDCKDVMFTKVEDKGRFNNALAIECWKLYN